MKAIAKTTKRHAARTCLPPLTGAPFIIRTRTGAREPAEETRWPKIGGFDARTLRQDSAFGRDDFLARFTPGDDVFAYACGSDGTMALGRSLHLPIYKAFGLTQQADLLIRQKQISADAYGSYHRAGEIFKEDPGFARYEMQTCELSFEPHANSPVSTVPRGLRIRLPRTMSFDSFHENARQAFAPATLNAFLRSPVGRRHLDHLGCELHSALRYTKYRWGGTGDQGVDFRLANELLICRPRQDFSCAAAVFERIILEHVLGLPAR